MTGSRRASRAAPHAVGLRPTLQARIRAAVPPLRDPPARSVLCASPWRAWAMALVATSLATAGRTSAEPSIRMGAENGLPDGMLATASTEERASRMRGARSSSTFQDARYPSVTHQYRRVEPRRAPLRRHPATADRAHCWNRGKLVVRTERRFWYRRRGRSARRSVQILDCRKHRLDPMPNAGSGSGCDARQPVVRCRSSPGRERRLPSGAERRLRWRRGRR